MIPTRLELRNCRTYDTLDLDLPEGALAVLGINGAGKSTLVNAIDVALFGPESVGPGKATLAPWLSEDAPDGTLSICLYFNAGIYEYRVRRTFSAKGRGASKVDFEEGDGGEAEDGRWLPSSEWRPLTRESTAETQAELERITGLTRDTFRASSFISQNVMFCDLAPREQKRLLGELLQLGQWDVWLERARSEKRAAELQIAEVDGMLQRADQELAERSAVEAERAEAVKREVEARTALESALSRLAVAREALAEARRRVESRAGAEKALQTAVQMLAEASEGVMAREDAIRALDARLEARPGLEMLAGQIGALEDERESLRVALLQWDERERLIRDKDASISASESHAAAAAKLAQRALTVLEGIGTESCDRCGQTLGADAAKRAVASYNSEQDEEARKSEEAHQVATQLAVAITELPAEQPDRDHMALLHDQIQKAQNARAQLAALDEAMQRRDDLTDEVRQMRAELPERETAVGTARAELDALGPHDLGERGRAEKLVQDWVIKEMALREDEALEGRYIARYEERLARLDKIAAEAGASRDRRDKLHTEQDLLANLERACGPNGVPTLILENVAVPQIETAANQILERFGSKAIGVELLTQREKKTGGLADTLTVNVLTEYGSRPYSTFSTGEKLRINAAITLAIAQLVAARSTQTGLLVIDDLGPLDSHGMAVLAEICNEVAERVGRCYVISQSPELRDAFEQSLEIVSDGSRSHIVGGLTEPEDSATKSEMGLARSSETSGSVSSYPTSERSRA